MATNSRTTQASALVGAFFAAATATQALALDKVSYGTNWLAQAEHGGFYQAVADGTYEKYGLDVTIVQGGPQSPNRAMLIAGKVDFYMGSPQGQLDAVTQNIPILDVAAIFQKDPQILMAHPDQGIDNFEDLAKLSTILMSKDGFLTYFQWMKANFEGFRDEQFKPYTFNPAPFIINPKASQQGYLTSEPYSVEKEAGWKPKVFLLADAGYSPYSTMITTQQKLVDENPDLVQRFVDASIEGWYNYIYNDNTAANALIKKDNPDMTDEQITFSIEKLKEYGIVFSGDAEESGIGCITDAHYKQFFHEMVEINLFEADLDYTKAFTTEFVCKNVGADLKN